MADKFIIGLDFGTETARGIRISIATGKQEASSTRPYPHGVMTGALPSGRILPQSYALQDADDYLVVAESLLRELGEGREIAGIGVDFTASSPLPCLEDGTPLSRLFPQDPHAFVKLWKHGAAQPYASDFLLDDAIVQSAFGGRVSGEWLLAKARQISAEAPDVWARTDRFIEAGDWLVRMLTGNERRSGDFASYKAQFDWNAGYPSSLTPDIAARLAEPSVVGISAGSMTADWRERTGIRGLPAIAVAAIDSHAVLPAVTDGAPKTLTCAIGTSAAYLYLTDRQKQLPPGVEGVAVDAALPDLWCYEAGQAAYGDVLAWFVKTFPLDDTMDESFDRYNHAARALSPGEHPLLALDWWSGNRVPYSDSSLSGMLLGMTLATDGPAIYRALVESLCFGTRSVVDMFEQGGLPVDRIIVTSGLSRRNPFVVATLADVLGRPVEVPEIDNATCVGAAIHGAVAAGVVKDFSSGFRRFGASASAIYQPRPAQERQVYDDLYLEYQRLAQDNDIKAAMHTLRRFAGELPARIASQTDSSLRRAEPDVRPRTGNSPGNGRHIQSTKGRF